MLFSSRFVRRHSVSVGLAGVSLLACTAALQAQTSQPPSTNTRSIAISVPAGSLESGLLSLGRQTKLRLLYPSALTAGKQTSGVSATASPEQAVDRLLAGTGLSYRFSSANTVTISDRVSSAHAAIPDGAEHLETITVVGGVRAPEDAPFTTPEAVAYISQETIERFRGSSPGDIFRGTPGVLSGDTRNGGAIDVNIRGMQGMGRVAVTIDGATNSTTAYQGYQGVSNRTYLDPDLIGGISIQKGPASGPGGGIGGSVAMHTITADDIIDGDKNFGVRLKAGAGTNTSDVPPRGQRGGIGFSSGGSIDRRPDTRDVAGMDRPSSLEPTRGYGSIAAAGRGENYEVVAAYAKRRSGNYHAGTNGPVAEIGNNIGPYQNCTTFDGRQYCSTVRYHYPNLGLTAYRGGEQVLNSSSETESWLTKGKLSFGDGHDVEIGYSGVRSEHGDVRASTLSGPYARATQQWLSKIATDSYTARYRFAPDDNELINIKANAFLTNSRIRNPAIGGETDWPVWLPRPNVARVLVGTDALMWGGDVSNTSRFETTSGDLSLEYGASYLSEDAEPTELTRLIEAPYGPRNGTREEQALFARAEWTASDWLTLDGGLRYQAYETRDRSELRDTTAKDYAGQTGERSGDGVAPSIGAVVTPMEGVQIYGRYSEGLRMPSLTESASMAFTYVKPGIRPERSQNWELGVNVDSDGVLTADDEAAMKLSWFDNTVKDYLSRRTMPITTNGYTWTGLVVDNIHAAKFQGIELSGRYGLGGFSAEFGANYYTNVEFCPTASTCRPESLYADYATNHVPPEYALSLTLSQKLFDDAITIGGRVTHTGARAVPHGAAIASGAAQYIEATKWKPYTLVDVFAEHKINDNFTATFRVENLMDVYYVDPLGLTNTPGPGRTAWLGLTATF